MKEMVHGIVRVGVSCLRLEGGIPFNEEQKMLLLLQKTELCP
jgi:hypothetical protein